METRPEISVIIPIYNAELFIAQCLDSILMQDVKDIEIVCVNDNSTDKTLSILEDYSKKDERITIITNNRNLRAGGSRNQGLKIAKGKYIHFMDADDYLTPDAYKELVSKAMQYNVDLLKAKAYAVQTQTGEIVCNEWYNLDVLEKEDFNIVTSFKLIPQKFMKVAVTPWSGIYKRDFLLKNKIEFNDLICVNDRSFFNKVIINTERVMFLDQYFIYHRIENPGSLSSIRARNFYCHFASYNIVKEQVADLSDQEKYYVLEAEIQDVFAWYRKYQREKVLGKHISYQTKQFIEELDLSDFGNKLKNCSWYDDYIKLIKSDGKKPQFLKFYFLFRKISGFFRCIRQHGIKYTLHLILRKSHILRKAKG